MTAVIRDASGQQMASVQLCPANDIHTISIERVLEGKGTLLNYYFGRGGRKVTLESDTFQLHGTLKTHWAKNERKWRLELEPAEAERAAALTARQAS